VSEKSENYHSFSSTAPEVYSMSEFARPALYLAGLVTLKNVRYLNSIVDNIPYSRALFLSF
jgi:hypothetical protein